MIHDAANTSQNAFGAYVCGRAVTIERNIQTFLSMRLIGHCCACLLLHACVLCRNATCQETVAKTSLDNPAMEFRIATKPYVVLARGEVRAVVVDNSAVNDQVLSGHRAGYSGLASLTHAQRRTNLFVSAYAGLNFEHIHDGTVRDRKVLFEPRNAPMQLRVIDEFTCELYQAPTPTWQLESCSRFELLEDGTVQLTFECIPRAETFSNGYLGLFWASYIQQPEMLDIHFRGHATDQDPSQDPNCVRWIRGITPSHGSLSTHLASDDLRTFQHDRDFPLTLVFNRSKYRYSEAWYYGISHGMALVLMFRPQDEIRFSQSPSGGGSGNPAWDFQYFVPGYRIDQRYQLVMRAMLTPFESPSQIDEVSRTHRQALLNQ